MSPLPSDAVNAPAITRIAYGDAAVMLEVTGTDMPTRREVTRALRGAVLANPPSGVVDVVGGLESVLVRFDCAATRHDEVGLALDRLVRDVEAAELDSSPGCRFVVPVRFGGEYGPDLESVAEELSMSAETVVGIFTSATLVVDVLAAGIAPMMHGTDFGASVARCRTPRAHVPAGAVMVAGHNAIIGPAPGPSGWRILGRTPVDLVDIHRDPVAHYAPGDLFRFIAITDDQWSGWAGRPLEPSETGAP